MIYPSRIITAACFEEREVAKKVPRTLRALGMGRWWRCTEDTGAWGAVQGELGHAGGVPAALRPPGGPSSDIALWLLTVLACPGPWSFLSFLPLFLEGSPAPI